MRPQLHRRVRTYGAMLAAAALAAVLVSPAPPFASVEGWPVHPEAPVAEWPTPAGWGGTQSSPLSDLTTETVAGLEVAWVYRTGDVSPQANGRAGTAFQATPVMVDGTLYFPTPFGRVIALDAETGEERWTFDPGVDRSDRTHEMVASRGVAVWTEPGWDGRAHCGARVLAVSYDARLFALDGVTGTPCAGFGEAGVVDLREGVARIEGREDTYKATAPPTVVHDLVVVGSKISDNLAADAPSGVVRAFDVRDGSLRWSWEPLEAVGAVDEEGRWVPAGAANAWASMTADEAGDLLFVPTGSASPDHYGGLRPGDNRYANSLVALRASSGELVWHFQTVHHDLWDYDLATTPALVTVLRGDVEVPAVVQATKSGYLFVLHRETGEPLFPVAERPVPASDVPGEEAWPTQPLPLLPRPLSPQGLGPDEVWGLTPADRAWCRRRVAELRHDGVFAPPSLQGTVVMPGFLGGLQWGGVAWDPSRDRVFVNANHVATVATLIPREAFEREGDAASGRRRSMSGPQSRTPYGVRREALLSPLGVPCNPPPWGTLLAVDLRTGDVSWEVPLGTMRDLVGFPTPRAWGSPNLGGPLVTGDLLFIGASMDRRLRAFDVETGKMVWEVALPASAQATPLTYRARPGGRQMLVVAAGGHAGMGTALGDHVIAWALPGRPRPVEEP